MGIIDRAFYFFNQKKAFSDQYMNMVEKKLHIQREFIVEILFETKLGSFELIRTLI